MNTETQPETLLMNPGSLVDHPALERLTPALDRALEPAEEQAFRKSIAQQGVLQPVIITWEHGTPYLLDGRRRVKAARDLGIEVPCHAVEPEQAYTAVITGLTTRRSLTKTAQTLAALPLLEPAIEEARARQLACLRRGDSPRVPLVGDGKTIESIASTMGIGVELLRQCRLLAERMQVGEDWREEIERQVYEEGKGAGGIIAGWSGLEATKGKPRAETLGGRAGLLLRSISETAKRWRYWAELEDQGRQAVTESVVVLVEDMPDEVAVSLAKALAARRKN